ncbi:hypothetical protein ABIA35_006421 [Catenulispora sp. MAP12-49]|jgi:hypothetical protein|uniref:hypothetical protein n=1 Tax=unclassified Catenulispora TaxID=414885 RepID=UPI003515BE6B
MYAGGLLATVLILGLILLVTMLAVVISEPREVRAPHTRENPADMTRRLRGQKTRGGKRAGSDGGARV